MSAQHAVLGLLLDRPAYAYQLANRLEERLGPAWAINSGQLSATLQKLEGGGLVQEVDDPSENRKGRRIFAITKDGIDEFERWWSEEQRGNPLSRRPLLLKLALAGPERLKTSLRQIEAYELECAERLKEVASQHDAVPEGPQLRADHVLLKLGLRGDMFQLEGELAWSTHAHEVVSWLLSREAIWPATRSPQHVFSGHDPTDAQERLFGRMAARPLHPADPEGERSA
jgi:DNA-binding PadR family transcriptional regulator